MTTTVKFHGQRAQATMLAYQQFQAGNKSGSFPCPRCGGRITFTALLAHKSSGQCSTSGCIRWNS